VVETEQVKHRCVQIVDMDPVRNGIEPKLVRFTDDLATFTPPPASHIVNASM